MTLRVLLRGGGDLASGVALRCFRAGWQVCVTELPAPLAVRRTVSFSQAIYDGSISIEGVRGERVSRLDEVTAAGRSNVISVMVDPECAFRFEYLPQVLVDARMSKQPVVYLDETIDLTIGLGPGFSAGDNCHAVVETLRGHHLGRVIWNGSAAANTGIPDRVGNIQEDRVIRAPLAGKVQSKMVIGVHVNAGEVVANIGGEAVITPISGILRGLIQDGTYVTGGMKIGDVDPRDDPSLCKFVSDKALAVGGGVLEAILSWPKLRERLYDK